MSTIGVDLLAWNDSAERWIMNADRIAAMTVEASDALIALLQPEPGQRLLDVAAGVGDPTFRLAGIVGPVGHITATDGVAGMCEELKRRAAARGLAQITVLARPAEALDFPASSFDGACCRFGAMFFADPEQALRRMLRAVRRDGRLVLAVWAEKQANPYFTLVMDALDEVGAPPVPLVPGTRTPFEFSHPGDLLGVAQRAGWRNVHENAASLSMRLPATTPATLLDALAAMSGRVADRLALLDPSQLASVRAEVARRGAPFVQGPDIVFPARILLISGQS